LPFAFEIGRQDAGQEADIMRNRLAALAVTALVLVGAAQARAGLGGLAGGCNCAPATGEVQTSVAACDTQLRPSYKVVYDSVQEKRTKVCYETVKETVMKPVTKTCFRDECKTCYKTVHEFKKRSASRASRRS
jgi:hypothetical protein